MRFLPVFLLTMTLMLAGCGQAGDRSTSGQTRSRVRQAGASCTDDDGSTYASGAKWQCADGCNSCSCRDGRLMSTEMACY